MTKSECYLEFRKQFPNWLMCIENDYIEIEYNNYSTVSNISFFELNRIRKFFDLSEKDDLIIFNRIVQDTNDGDYLRSRTKIPIKVHFEKDRELLYGGRGPYTPVIKKNQV